MNTQFSSIDNILSNIETSQASTISTLQEVGLDWQVNRVQLCTPDGTPVDYYANQRADNSEVLAVVSDGYQIFQNEEMVELCESLANTFDYKIHKGGQMDGGRKVYIQLESDSVHGIGENNDTINRYITAVNSHDCTTSLSFGSLGFTISCRNTFFAAARSKNMSRIRHTSTMRERVEMAKRQIEGLKIEEASLYEKFFSMASVEATPEHITKIVKQTLDIDINQRPNELKENYSTRRINLAESLLSSIKREMSYKGNTLWGLMSGVTHYTSHVQSAPNRLEGRTESKLLGQAQKMDNVAFEYLSGIIA